LRTFNTAALHAVLVKISLTISAALPCIPLLLEVPVNAATIYIDSIYTFTLKKP